MSENANPTPPMSPLKSPPEDSARSERSLRVLSGVMPWALSLLFHLSLFVVTMFVVFMVLSEEQAEDVPDAIWADIPEGQMAPGEMRLQDVSVHRPVQKRQFVRKTVITTEVDPTAKPVDIIGLGASSAPPKVQMGLSTVEASGPKSEFFGSGRKAYNVVYVIDRSGSMVDTFDLVRQEMLRSIGRLRDTQRFHVILFSEGRPLENPPRKLIPATRRNKKDVARFLSDVTPETRTQPISALQRAFAVLRGAKKHGKVIYLLTDGEFRNNAKVLHAVETLNAVESKVHINTFLYGAKPPEAVAVMKDIAKTTGGRYTFVPSDQ